MEIVVSFTDETEEVMLAKGYTVRESELGKVYYPSKGVKASEKIIVKYVEYPWISCFEAEGLELDKEETEKEEVF